jgi:peptidoglycan hydrolase-like protein with peptidoglycan-binding domain
VNVTSIRRFSPIDSRPASPPVKPAPTGAVDTFTPAGHGQAWDLEPATDDAGTQALDLEPATDPVPDAGLNRGAKGDQVLMLQTHLVTLGFLKADDMKSGPGSFGPLTEAALKKFQAASDLPVTGYYGNLSRAAMITALAEAMRHPIR